ncbi:hypothetical protein G9A89_001125 [Geosiphon pyriformis]|nr:hypothetical protein G9A89_001125 [Geosiphon pyriformis]
MTIIMKKENKEKNIFGEPPSKLELTTTKKTQPKNRQIYTLFASHYYSHHLFYLNTKTVKRNSHSWEHGSHQMKTTECKHIITANHAITNAIDIQSTKASGTTNHVSLVANSYLIKGCETTFLVKKEYVIWQMANVKVQRAMPSEILEIKNNSPKQVDIILIPNPDIFLDIKTNLEDFHEYYQNLALTKEEQEQWLVQLNTRLYLNPNSNYEQYIVLPDLTKEQELKWYSDNNEGIMPECVHDTDAGFDLRYSGKNAIKLEPHSHICIDLKISLEILATTIIQLASRSSLAKRGINIKGRIIDAEYVRNIIAMLQNNSEKAYVIEPNEKIVQAIFLFLVKIAQLVSMRNKEELGITARGIQGFGSMGRVDIPVNMVEEEIIDKREIISTGQLISIPPYDQYMVVIEKKVKDQNQIFEAEAACCELGEIELINLHIPTKNYSHIKIPIYNNTGKIIEIPEGTIIGHSTTKIDQTPFQTFHSFMDI